MRISIACDVMVDLEGSVRPAVYLAEAIARKGLEVSIVSPYMSKNVEKYLKSAGINPRNLRLNLLSKKYGASLLWLECWAKEAFLKMNSKKLNEQEITINFSQNFSIPSKVWYLQGPLSTALDDISQEFSLPLKLVHTFLRKFIERADRKMMSSIANSQSLIIANSKFCASMYQRWGINVHDVIYPPIDCEAFHPSTTSPSSDYFLTYFGKETKYSVIKRVADLGVKIKAFGSKMAVTRKDILDHPNIVFLGRVNVKELVDLYTNALVTLFPFTHEPFGYVPLESMACGTPVLTYKRQGPGEYLINGRAGWLVNSDDDFVKIALKLWKNGYPQKIRMQCVKQASKLDKRFYMEKWSKILSRIVGYEDRDNEHKFLYH